jgi:hypothetical protein
METVFAVAIVFLFALLLDVIFRHGNVPPVPSTEQPATPPDAIFTVEEEGNPKALFTGKTLNQATDWWYYNNASPKRHVYANGRFVF